MYLHSHPSVKRDPIKKQNPVQDQAENIVTDVDEGLTRGAHCTSFIGAFRGGELQRTYSMEENGPEDQSIKGAEEQRELEHVIKVMKENITDYLRRR